MVPLPRLRSRTLGNGTTADHHDVRVSLGEGIGPDNTTWTIQPAPKARSPTGRGQRRISILGLFGRKLISRREPSSARHDQRTSISCSRRSRFAWRTCASFFSMQAIAGNRIRRRGRGGQGPAHRELAHWRSCSMMFSSSPTPFAERAQHGSKSGTLPVAALSPRLHRACAKGRTSKNEAQYQQRCLHQNASDFWQIQGSSRERSPRLYLPVLTPRLRKHKPDTKPSRSAF